MAVASASPTAGLRAPVPPTNRSVPPGRILPVAKRARWRGSQRCSSTVRSASAKSVSAKGA